MTNAIAITGLGAVSPFGLGCDRLLRALRAGQSGSREVTAYSTQGLRFPDACVVEREGVGSFLDPLRKRRLDFAALQAVDAAQQALSQAGLLPLDTAFAPELGVVLGTATAGIAASEQFLSVAIDVQPSAAPPLLFPNTLANTISAHVSIVLGAQGLNFTLTQKECSSALALLWAVVLLQTKQCRAVVAGGSEELTYVYHRAYDRLRALPRDRAPSIPLDRQHHGAQLGEGAYMVVLERLEEARARHATVLAILESVTTAGDPTCSPFRWPSSPDTPRQNLQQTLESAGRSLSEIGWINCSANGIPQLDNLEVQALAELLGASPGNTRIASLKSSIGESGASAAAQLVASCLALRLGIALPNGQGCEPCEGLPESCFALAETPLTAPAVLINSLAHGGLCASMIVAPGDPA